MVWSPDYPSIFLDRAHRLRWLAENPYKVASLKRYYRDHIVEFINDWGVTLDTRNAGGSSPPLMPFVLFPKQADWVEWTLENWRTGRRGLTEKSREVGITWCAVALAVSLCLLYDKMIIGFGSRKEEYVDAIGNPKSILEKVRIYLEHMPPEFTGGWEREKNGSKMRILFPETGSLISGESGDDIGRGDRCAIYFVDEAAHLEHPQVTEASLSATTRCRQDLSSVKGMANPFAVNRFSGKHRVFTFHWRDDPRKDDAWYTGICNEYDPVTVAQEYDINYSASVEGLIIPAKWVQAAVDAHVKLAIAPSGVRRGALDIADEGKDLNAFCARHGVVVLECLSWTGKDRDVGETANRAYSLCDDLKLDGFDYDADGGYGTGVRSEANRIDERRRAARMAYKRVAAFRGSAAVFDPERKVPGTDVLAKDRFQNLKAQSYHHLAERFRHTWRAVNGMDYDPDMIISLSSSIKELAKLQIELSQPQWKMSTTGKYMVDKMPDGARSPNLADAVMMAFGPRRLQIQISDKALLNAGRVEEFE